MNFIILWISSWEICNLAVEIREPCSKCTPKSSGAFIFAWWLCAHSFAEPQVGKDVPSRTEVFWGLAKAPLHVPTPVPACQALSQGIPDPQGTGNSHGPRSDGWLPPCTETAHSAGLQERGELQGNTKEEQHKLLRSLPAEKHQPLSQVSTTG